MLSHADLSSFIANPKLLVVRTCFEALTGPANMAREISLAHHAATLSSVVGIVCLALFSRSGCSQMPRSIQFRH